jgi:hypothetical protein
VSGRRTEATPAVSAHALKFSEAIYAGLVFGPAQSNLHVVRGVGAFLS